MSAASRVAERHAPSRLVLLTGEVVPVQLDAQVRRRPAPEGRHLLGAAAGLRETVGSSVYGYYLPDESLRASAEQSARTALGDDAYDRATGEGRGLGLNELVAAVFEDRGH